MVKTEVCIFWFRRDLRLHDNAGLYHALNGGRPVLPVFVFDEAILNKLPDRADRRVAFIHQALSGINEALKKGGSSLTVANGSPLAAFKELLNKYNVGAVYTNHDYEPYARQRDEEVRRFLDENGISLYTFKDQCIFEKDEVMKDDGKPYTVFTPYSRKWKKILDGRPPASYNIKALLRNFVKLAPLAIPSLAEIGFKDPGLAFKAPTVSEHTIRNYKEQRDIPSVAGTSRLSLHLRFGAVSIRELVQKALPLSETWLNELIWRDFYMMILWQFPHVAERAFKPEYDRIPWRNNETEFRSWREGKTGFPIVDAGMRELNVTGFMHNRVRMITASFLVKDLLIDWRWGEAYFAEKLLDFDLSANNGGWQWAAGSGCDAAPYFRIFNPDSQQQKFDPEFSYIKKWLPEFGTRDYPSPIVDHAAARNRALSVYKAALAEQKQMKLF
ncbi:MAG: cryptochrome/photolyase family protein [Bacteroidia bacterium]